MQSIWLSSLISSKSCLDFLLAACQKAEEEEAAEHRKILESDFELAENKNFIDTITPLDDFFLKEMILILKKKWVTKKMRISENKSIHLSLELLSLELLG